DNWDFLGDPAAVIKDFVLRTALEPREVEQRGVIAEAARNLRLAQSLLSAAGDPGDENAVIGRPIADRLCGDAQDRLVKADLADRELRRMDPNGHAVRAGVDIVSRERALPDGIERARPVEGKGMRRKSATLADAGDDG